MRICRTFLVGILLAVGAPAQQPSDAGIPPAPAYKLEGRVVKEPGDWIQIHAPQIVDSEDKVLFTARSLDVQTGAFAFWPVPAGTYTLRVSGMIDVNPELRGTVYTRHKIVVASDLTNVELTLGLGTVVQVTVRKKSEAALGRCWWSPLAEMYPAADCSGYRAASVQLIPVDSRRDPYLSGAGILKDPTHFKMVGIEPGKYVVRVTLPAFPDNYVQSVRSGNLDLLHEQLDVPEYETVLPIDVVVRDDFGYMKIQTSEGAKRPLIVLLREGVLLPAPQIPIRFREEDFSFPVAPGSYAVFAFDSVIENCSRVDCSNGEYLSEYAGRAVHVTVSAKETKTVHVDVIHIEN